MLIFPVSCISFFPAWFHHAHNSPNRSGFPKDMIRILIKFSGYVLLTLAVVSAILDITRSIADSMLVFKPLGQDWHDISPSTLEAAQAGIQREVHPWLWEGIIQNILLLPTWSVLGFLALLLIFLGRKRKASWQEKYGA